ncbi:3077_t:CDS:1, partial [Ambispora gerdemannii]
AGGNITTRTNNTYDASPSITNNGSSNAFFAAIFQPSQESQSVREEVYTYMDNIITPQVTPDINPWKWWAEHEKKFPMLAIMTHKYLSIPATSVPSE